MKHLFHWGCACLLFLFAFETGAAPRSTAEFYVSVNGNDQNPGTKQAPFATLERAREAIRNLKKETGLPQGGVRVILTPGTYHRTTTFCLGAEDGGSETSPIVYTGLNKDSVRFVGGDLLDAWQPVSDPAVKERLDPQIRDSVYECDLSKLGITDWGVVATAQTDTKRADLLCNGKYMSLARYPDAGEWLKIADVPMNGPKKYFYDGITHYGRFVYDGDRPSRWKDYSDIWMQGYWVHDWRDGIHRVARIDTVKHEIFPEPPYHVYGYRTGQRYFFMNVLEELTVPGEWYLDRKEGKLYFYPPCPIEEAEIILPELSVPMIEIDSAAYVAIEGITMQASRHGGVVIRGGHHNEVRGCAILNMAHLGIDVEGGTNHGVQSCDLYELAQGAIKMTGGDRKTLTPSGHYIDNTEIYHNGQIFQTQTPAIEMQGVGIRVSHLFLHDTPHTGIFYYGNDHLFEYCEFTRIAQQTGDVGCIYAMADWTFQGNVIRYNYFHDIHSPGHFGSFAIYPDLPNGGMHVYGNIFYNIDWVFHTNSGRGMLVENNLILKSNGFSYKVWPFKDIFFPKGAWQIVEHMEEVNYDQPPYSTRYPVLQQLAKDMQQSDSTVQVMERQLCKDNLIRNNIATGDIFLRFIGPVDLKQVVVQDNLIASEVPYTHSPINTYDDFNSYTDNAPEVIAQLKAMHNIITKDEIGIVDPAHGDYSFKAGSPAAKFRFQPIPVEKIGLQSDSYRGNISSSLRK